jgi:hypothetical protein
MSRRLAFIFSDAFGIVIFSIMYTHYFEKYFLWILLSRIILWPLILLWPGSKKDNTKNKNEVSNDE